MTNHTEAGEHLKMTQADIARAASQTAILQHHLDITNADHIALWLEANTIPDEPMSQCISWLACRIVEAHEAATRPNTPDEVKADQEPVAWMYEISGANVRQVYVERRIWNDGWTETPLYAAPPASPDRLTKEETIEAVQCLLERGKATLNSDGYLELVGSPSRNAVLEEALNQAARWFEDYAEQHNAKALTASDSYENASRIRKFALNRDRAAYCRAALRTPEAPAQVEGEDK